MGFNYSSNIDKMRETESEKREVERGKRKGERGKREMEREPRRGNLTLAPKGEEDEIDLA